VGRARERAALIEALASGGRLAVLTGPGGIGKTRLALEFLAADWPAAAPEPDAAVMFVDLGEVTDADGVVDGVSAALELPDPAGARGGAARIVGAAAAVGPSLLVLDSVDGVVAAASDLIEAMLSAAPELRVLVTSRERLGLAGEQVVDLPPLSVAPADGEEAEAVSLFTETAARVAGHWRMSDEDRPYVEEIVALLDGIPLAIELAAPRLQVMGPRALLHRLRNRFDLLNAPRRGAPARHATVHAAVDFSWRVLTRDEQRALACCAVFRGGFTLAAGEAVVGEGDVPAVDHLQALRAKSLLRVLAEEAGEGDLRLGLYETVRQFAADRLDEAGLRREAEARHAAHFVAWGRCAIADAGGVDHPAAWTRLARERDNLLAVAERVVGGGPVSARAAEPALEALLLLEPVLLRRGPLERFAALLQPVLEATARSGADPLLYCQALAAQGNLLRQRGDPRQGLQNLVHALSIAREIDAPEMVARGSRELAEALTAVDQLDDAEEQLDVAARSSAALSDEVGEGRVARARARLAERRADPAGAREWLERALAAHVAADAEPDRAEDLRLLGRLHLDAGRPDLARIALDEAALSSSRAGDRREVARIEGLRALADHMEGDLTRARVTCLAAAGSLERRGFQRGAAELRAQAALAAWEAGADVEARALLARASRGRAGDDPALDGWIDGLRAALDAPVESLDAAGRRLVDAAPHPALAAAARHGLAAVRERAGERRIAAISPEDLVVGADGCWFRGPGGEAVDLRRRKPLRRLLAALVERRQASPGGILDADALLAAGWPGERVIAEAGAHRVRVAVSTLRKLGLRRVLVTVESGYRLDPAVALHELD